LAKQKRGLNEAKVKQKIDLYMRPTPPEVIQNALKIQRKACGLTVNDFVHAFKI